MTDSDENAETPRTKPGEGAWLEAKRAIADRNDNTQKTGKAERTAREQSQKAARVKAEQNGVYR